MKQGGSTIDTNVLATGRGLSSGSPSVAPVWTSPTTVKASVGTTGSYIPSYTSWYPSTHQESMQQSQLMWRVTGLSGRRRALQPAVRAAQHWWCSTMKNNNNKKQQPETAVAASLRADTRRPAQRVAGRGEAGGRRGVQSREIKKAKRILLLDVVDSCLVILICLKSLVAELVLFMRKHGFVYANMSGLKVMAT